MSFDSDIMFHIMFSDIYWFNISTSNGQFGCNYFPWITFKGTIGNWVLHCKGWQSNLKPVKRIAVEMFIRDLQMFGYCCNISLWCALVFLDFFECIDEQWAVPWQVDVFVSRITTLSEKQSPVRHTKYGIFVLRSMTRTPQMSSTDLEFLGRLMISHSFSLYLLWLKWSYGFVSNICRRISTVSHLSSMSMSIALPYDRYDVVESKIKIYERRQ